MAAEVESFLLFFLLSACTVPSHTRGPCDPLTPEYCQLPLPNSFFTRVDVDSPTGLRLNYSAQTWPKDSFGRGIDLEEWNSLGE